MSETIELWLTELTYTETQQRDLIKLSTCSSDTTRADCRAAKRLCSSTFFKISRSCDSIETPFNLKRPRSSKQFLYGSMNKPRKSTCNCKRDRFECQFMDSGSARLSLLSCIGGGRARCHSLRDWKWIVACATFGWVSVFRSSAIYAASCPSSPTRSWRTPGPCSVYE